MPNVTYHAYTTWQAEKSNLLWKDSVSNSNAIDFRGIRRICCALLYLYSHFDRIKEKRFPSADRAAAQKESSARFVYSNTSAHSSRSAFEKRGDWTGWRARWNLRLTRDTRRMYSTCRRCQTVKRPQDTPDRVAMSIASYVGVTQVSPKTLYNERESILSTNLRLIGSLSRSLFSAFCVFFPLLRGFYKKRFFFTH